MDPAAYPRSVRKYWPQLMQAASAVSITVAGFIKPPTYFDPVSTVSQTKRLAVFIVAILMAIFLYLAHKWPHRKHAKRWAVASFAMLIALIASELVFREFRTKCLCQYDQHPVLIGTELTPVAQRDLIKRQGVAACEDLLMDFQGRANIVWTTESINRCRHLIALAYWIAFATAGLTVLSALQIVRVYQSAKKK